MNKLFLSMSFLLASLATTACVEPDTGSSTGRVIIEQPCAADADCPAGFECEIEDEHGVTTSFCQSHDGPEDEDGDGVCPAGYELEVEHGQAYCKPHGGDDGSGGGSGAGDDDGGTGPGTLGETCAADADCGAGLECEVEVEHGVTTSTCQPHGGA